MLAADARLTALAKWLQERGAVGTISQLRAAVYTALLSGRPVESLLPEAADSDAAPGSDAAPASDAALAGEDAPAPWHSPAWPAVSGTIHLTMPLSAWLGDDEPGDVAGHGPVDAATSRELAAMLPEPGNQVVPDGDWRRWQSRRSPAAPPALWASRAGDQLGRRLAGQASDPRDSQLQPQSPVGQLSAARLTWAPDRRPAATCCFRGLSASRQTLRSGPSVPFDEGGRTCVVQICAPVRRHDRAKQASGCAAVPGPAGCMSWTLPSGPTMRLAPSRTRFDRGTSARLGSCRPNWVSALRAMAELGGGADS